MNIDQISMTTLRVFQSVFETKSMSKSANILAMTQPGVSQHIKGLEELLKVKLFDRVSRKLLATNAAQKLYDVTKVSLEQLESILSDVSTKENELSGKLKIGMPIEFGNNRVLPIISNWLRKHPKVSVSINYDHAQRQGQMIIDGDLDFAITDSYNFPKQIRTQNVSSENLILCCSKQYAKDYGLSENSRFKNYDQLDFITYLEGAPIISQWFKYHFNRVFHGNVKSQLMDVQGVLQLTLASVGLAVLPLHVIKQADNEDNLILFKGTKDHLINELNFAYLNHREHSQLAISLFEELEEQI